MSLDEAIAHHQAGRLAEAEAGYRQVLEHDPRNADALHFLGFLAFQHGAHERAAELIARSLAVQPANVHAHYNLGRVRHAQARFDEALASYGAALNLQPRYVEALFGVAGVHDARGDLPAAIGAYRRVVELQPSHVAALLNLGTALKAAGETTEALSCYREALRHAPEAAEAHYNLGIAARDAGLHDEALAAFRRAIALRPAFVDAHYGLGHVLLEAGRTAEGIAAFERVLALAPDHVRARWSLVMAHLPTVYGPDDDPAECRRRFAAGIDGLAAWLAAHPDSFAYAAVGSDQPFALAYQEEDNRALLARYGALCTRLMADWQKHERIGVPQRRSARKVRVGIVSAHFTPHSVWNAITKGWLERIDRRSLEVVAFDLGNTSFADTAQARSYVAHYDAGPRELRDWVSAIQAQAPDVLIYPEIGMEPMATRLASLRLAPVQAVSWGHPETSGLPTLDYFISAEAFEPPEADAYYTERLVRLPGIGVYLRPDAMAPEPPDLQRWGIDADTPLLICPGTPFKYAPAFDATLAEIARRLGDCCLLFFRHWNHALSSKLEQRLQSAFARHGVDYARTVKFIPWQPAPAFHGWLSRADAYLDTIGFSGFNTALQAVACELPIVTREGRFMRGRLASGILKRMGLDDLIAPTEQAYIELAVRLVEDADFSEHTANRMAAARPSLYEDMAPIHALQEFLARAAASVA